MFEVFEGSTSLSFPFSAVTQSSAALPVSAGSQTKLPIHLKLKLIWANSIID